VVQFIIRTLEPETDFRTIYLVGPNYLTGKRLAGCINGLSKYGRKEDRELIEKYLVNHSASVVGSAMSCLMRINGKI